MRPRPVWLPVAISIPLLIGACASDAGGGAGGAGGDLTGVTWVLDRASMMTLVDDVPKDARVDIAFDGSQARGSSGCNSYGGGYEATADPGELTFGDLASTAMACADDRLMGLESAYLAALGDVTGYQVVGAQAGLQLTGGKAALTFQPAPPPVHVPLEGTTWTLTSIASPDTDAVSSTLADTRLTLTMTGGDASGSGGCNAYRATYDRGAAGELTLSFGPVSATKKACEQPVSDQEHAYFGALSDVATYAIEGDALTLYDGSGALRLEFRAAQGQI
jgi:heat shock protein HslJ